MACPMECKRQVVSVWAELQFQVVIVVAKKKQLDELLVAKTEQLLFVMQENNPRTVHHYTAANRIR